MTVEAGTVGTQMEYGVSALVVGQTLDRMIGSNQDTIHHISLGTKISIARVGRIGLSWVQLDFIRPGKAVENTFIEGGTNVRVDAVVDKWLSIETGSFRMRVQPGSQWLLT